MSSLAHRSRTAAPRPRRLPWLALPLALGAGVLSFSVMGRIAPPDIPPITIASVPLYAATQGDKPALALALSVEYPTVGAQYVDQPGQRLDESYTPTKEYIGYYNAEMCYLYRDQPTETPGTGETEADYKRFVISGPARQRQCADAFSGNFLNWATSSAIDMLRLALSGGDRIIDKPGLTVLQRAVLPNGTPSCFWNSQNFPAKGLHQGSDGRYAGAVPQAMIAAARRTKTETIWVANILNQIYFGTARGGSCGDPSSYALGASPLTAAMGPKTSRSGSTRIPGDPARCTGEGGTCNAGRQVLLAWYGAPDRGWVTAPVRGEFSCTNAIFGDPAPGTPKACYLSPYQGKWRPPSSGSSALNTDGFFYSRVEVCGKSSRGTLQDTRDYNFCTRYPDGNYKPTGTIQKYSNQLRLAAFGYAMEPTRSWGNGTEGRYGGVLRAPMKYVGQRTFNTTGGENTPITGNPHAEWNAHTGVFISNPDGDTTQTPGISGVINYLNKFGRTNQARPGFYKTYDPASELYYETLRYLQGLPPSPAAVANLDPVTNADFYDGFPIYRDWSQLDPYGNRSNKTDYSCLKSNIALIGDVNTHDSKHYGNSRMPATNIANNIPDIQGWLSVVQAFESQQAVDYVDGSGITRTTSNPNAASYSSTPSATNRGQSSELIGLAYWAHTHDIRGKSWSNAPDKQRPGLRVKSFFFDVNEYGNESNDTKRRTNNQYYTAAKYGGFLTQPGEGAGRYNIKGNPFYDQDGNADNSVWEDPDRQLEPQTYFLQSDARGVLAAFEKIFSNAASAERSIAGAAASSSHLTRSTSHVYQASYDTGDWSGDLQAFNINISVSEPPTGKRTSVSLGSTPVWSAEQQLAARIAAGTERNIVIGKQGANPVSPLATRFTRGEVEDTLKAQLNRYSPTAAADSLWQDRLDYLRGDKSKEGKPFRVRQRAMGDVVNSGVQYVGAPSPQSGLGQGHAAFAADQASRAPVVYVGANDGMLHAFNANTGQELFAYIPSWMGPKLSALTDPEYNSIGNHQAYVDATPVAGDAKTGSGASASDWKTVLVGGTGGGGRGVYALDISSPAAFAPEKVLWEFTHLNDADMGFVIGKPRIVRLRTSATDAATPTYRWFALVPSGVNNYVPDAASGRFSATGAPTLFLLALDKTPGQAWQLGRNYYKIALPFNADEAKKRATGVINLEAFMDSQGVVEAVFAGDLHGNLWALDFSQGGTDKWTAGRLSRVTTGSGASAKALPLYIAKDSDGNLQPITAAPTVLQASAPRTYYVGFGTGKYIEPNDATSTQQNTYYVVYDNAQNDTAGGVANTVGIAGRSRLAQVKAGTDGRLAPESAFAWGRPTTDSDTSQRAGWFHDMPVGGERIVYDSVYVPLTTKVAFSSLIPDSAIAPGVCSVAGGEGNGYYMDIVAGTGLRRASNVGVTGQPMVLFNDEGASTTLADSTGRRLRTRSVVLAQQGSASISAEEVGKETLAVGRLSWRQIHNYLELKNK
ncbi:pilus assembly protein PilY [Comamonadaceae bacterium OH2545_COT-014]|nr:pilus assembly protein PilY [Comamonadaceae bacterium OH2545_COT-014]